MQLLEQTLADKVPPNKFTSSMNSMKIKTLLAATLLMPTLALAETKSINKSGVPHPLYARMGLGISVPADLTLSETNTSGSVFISKEKPKNSFAFDIGLGYVFNEYYRTELALGYRSFQTDNVTLQTRSQFGFGVFHRITYRDVKMETTYGMLNGYFDLHNNTKLTCMSS